MAGTLGVGLGVGGIRARRAARRAAAIAKPTTGYAAMTATQQAKWDEAFARAAEIRDSGAKEIQNFMGIFDLQLHVLRTQQPRPELRNLVTNIRASIAKAQRYLGRPQPYGIADAQWMSLREMTGHAEEVAERFEMAIDDMERLAQQEAEVAELEQAAGIAAPAVAPAAVAPAVAVTPVAVTPAAPEALPVEVLPAPEPEPEPGFPTGWVIGGILTATALGVGGWLLLRGKGKKKGK